MKTLRDKTKEIQIVGNRYWAKRRKEHQPTMLNCVSKSIFYKTDRIRLIILRIDNLGK